MMAILYHFSDYSMLFKYFNVGRCIVDKLGVLAQ